MTRRVTKPLGRPPVRLGERMRIRVKDYEGRLFDEVLLAAIVRTNHGLLIEIISNHKIWRGAKLRSHQFVEVKG